MKKFIIALIIIGLVATIIVIGKNLYFTQYKKLSDDRVEQVVKFQKANLNNANITIDAYDSKLSCWVKQIYFTEDPEIRYEYGYDRSSNELRVSGMYKNMSLDLADKKAKYPLIDVYFDKKGNIKKIENSLTGQEIK